ncbi:BGTF surface domain-containing protein [Halorarius litoreus]|uniref:BGTF surface domain-containing protein n=1 Tax=Halorarius litoreus TaxID=2962676 RepID=UPI0020CD8459|nr:BGTF surface domain-containing protein [Halorarius litoreus]
MKHGAVAAGLVVAVVAVGALGVAVAPDGLLGPADPGMETPGSPSEPTATPGAQVDADAQFNTTAHHESVLLPARADALLTGSSGLEPGRTVTVRLASSDDGFDTTKEVVVLDDGTFGAVVNLKDVEPTTHLTATVSYNDTQLANDTVRVTGPNGTHFHVTGERITVQNTTGQTVRGATSLDPGTNVTVRARSSGSSPFLKSTVATVRENGTFVATFDFSGVDPGTEFTVTAHHAGDTVERSGAVTED